MNSSHLQNLPPEVFFNILIKLPYQNIITYCSTNKVANTVCEDNFFWQQKANFDFGILAREFNETNLTAELRYIEYLTIIGKDVVPGSENFIEVDTCLYRAAFNNNIPLINYFMTKGGDKNYAAKGAAGAGNMELLKIILNLKIIGPIDIKMISMEAARTGQLEILKYFNSIFQFDNTTMPLQCILNSAAKNGHEDIVRYFIMERKVDTQQGLAYASEVGDMEIIKQIEQFPSSYKQSDDYPALLENILYNASRGGHLELIKYVMSQGAQDLNYALDGAAEGGKIEIIKYLMSIGANDINSALEHIAEVDEGDVETFKYILSIGAIGDYNTMLNYAAGGENIEIVKYLVSLIGNNPVLINKTLLTAAKYGQLETVKFLVSQGANNLTEALIQAIEGLTQMQMQIYGSSEYYKARIEKIQNYLLSQGANAIVI